MCTVYVYVVHLKLKFFIFEHTHTNQTYINIADCLGNRIEKKASFHPPLS